MSSRRRLGAEPRTPMKILDVCAFYTPHGGGVKTYVEQKLAIGPELGHEIVIVAPGDSAQVIARGPRAKIIVLPSPRFPLDRKYWYFDDEAALHAVLDQEAPDFVEASSPWRSASMVARWPGPAHQVPRSLIMHADPLSAYAYRWFGPMFSRELIDKRFAPFWRHLRELGQCFDSVVCACGELKDRLAAGGVANTALHPMGIDAQMFSPARRSPGLRRRMLALCGLPETAKLLIGVGRLSPEKRWPVVVDAVMAASQTLPIGLIILGQGRHRTRVERQIAGNPHIRIIGVERDRAKFATLLASADAMIHGGDAETFCMVAAEARASGVPVIVPDRGGAADHAKGDAGITYQANNALSAAQATLKLLRHPPRGPFGGVVTTRDHFARLFIAYEALVAGARQVA